MAPKAVDEMTPDHGSNAYKNVRGNADLIPDAGKVHLGTSIIVVACRIGIGLSFHLLARLRSHTFSLPCNPQNLASHGAVD